MLMTFVIFFFLISPVIILYSAGWRIDLKTLSVQKTGGIFLKTKMKDVVLSIDGKSHKAKSRFLSGLFINNLLPRSYRLEVSKDGYHSWVKNLEVKPSLVTETKNIVLVPKNQNPIVFQNNILDFLVNGKLVVWQAGNGQYFLSETDKPESSVNLTLLFNNLKQNQLGLKGTVRIKNVFIKNERELFINTERAAYLVTIGNSTIKLLENGVEIAESEISPDGERTANVVPNGILIMEDGMPEVLQAPNPESIRRISWYRDSDHIFILYPEELYFSEIDSRSPISFFPIARNVEKFAYDAQSKRLYLLQNGNLNFLDF